MSVIRCALADDHTIFRKSLARLLAAMPGLAVVGDAADGAELLRMLDEAPADVVLVDLQMPVMDGLEATVHIRERHPETKVIILTMQDTPVVVDQLLQSGAHGYLLKNVDPDELLKAVHAVHADGQYENDLTRNSQLYGRVVTSRELNMPVALTKSEIAVLELICQECTTVEIGMRLFRSTRTVEGIRARLLQKTGTKTTAGLVVYAMQKGLLSQDSLAKRRF